MMVTILKKNCYTLITTHIKSLFFYDLDIQLYNFMNHTGLFLLPSLFYYTQEKKIKYCWNNKYKSRFNQTLFDEPTDEPTDKPNDKPTDEPTDESTDEPTDESTDGQSKLVFGIRNGRVWKSKFDEKMSKTI